MIRCIKKQLTASAFTSQTLDLNSHLQRLGSVHISWIERCTLQVSALLSPGVRFQRFTVYRLRLDIHHECPVHQPPCTRLRLTESGSSNIESKISWSLSWWNILRWWETKLCAGKSRFKMGRLFPPAWKSLVSLMTLGYQSLLLIPTKWHSLVV